MMLPNTILHLSRMYKLLPPFLAYKPSGGLAHILLIFLQLHRGQLESSTLSRILIGCVVLPPLSMHQAPLGPHTV